ncbi:MAG: hypothetical protein E4H06_04645 [Methanosarcina sp.]|nr:MAG: hypothetical protein E4H06_04645 [Methanosarcina sp.]
MSVIRFGCNSLFPGVVYDEKERKGDRYKGIRIISCYTFISYVGHARVDTADRAAYSKEDTCCRYNFSPEKFKDIKLSSKGIIPQIFTRESGKNMNTLIPPHSGFKQYIRLQSACPTLLKKRSH